VRVALAGLGAAATGGHLPALLDLESEGRLTIVGACDPDQRRRVAARHLFPRIPTFHSADEMLRSVDSELTVIAAHPAVHAELASCAAAHRQHILCEKPAAVTPAQLRQLCAIREHYPDRALVASYQYRFSRPWLMIAPFLHAAARSGRRVAIEVEVERCATDRRAMSSWRDDPAMGGGLADHAVHFLALAREPGHRFGVERAARDYDPRGRELVTARLSSGSNLVDLTVSYRAPSRSTAVTLRCGRLAVHWTDHELRLARDGSPGQPLVVRALSDRSYVDALYHPMYRDLLASLDDPEWRRERAEELADVAECLTVLLAAASAAAPEPVALAA